MATPSTLERLTAEFDSPPEAIAAAVALLEAKAPPAYIAHYRRWATANMHEGRLHALEERLHFLTEIEGRKAAILEQAKERGTLTPEIERILAETVDQDLVDDFYQSLRPRRRTVAMQMEEKGLGPLALAIRHRQLGDRSLQDAASEYVSEEQGLPTIEAVLEGVALILSEQIAGDPLVRARFRDELSRGILKARALSPESGAAQRFQEFFDFEEPLGKVSPARMLALRKAEREGILEVQLTLPEGRHREILRERFCADLAEGSQLCEFYDVVFDHAFERHLRESCGRDVQRRFKERADREAVRVFCRNLRSQMLAPPLGHKKVLVLRSSGKTVWVVGLAEDGSVASHLTLPDETEEQRKEALARIRELLQALEPSAIAIPHGRRQAGTEQIVSALRAEVGTLPMVVPVDEAASAIFATSQAGRKAMPGTEVGVRAAASLGRRLQDPLRELAGMDFRTLGLGQRLDDVHQGMLRREIDATLGACVAFVGTDVNRSDKDALARVPGISHDLAQAIVDHRSKNGPFRTRAALAEVPGMTEDVLRHVAGFLRIEGGDEPLDATAVHPDDYAIVRSAAAQKGCSVQDLFGRNLRDIDVDALCGPGVERPRAIEALRALREVGKDPRGELLATANEGVHSIADLRSDRPMKGRVSSLTEFGAFIDLGIGHDGLVHVSQIPQQRLRDPQQMLRVGEIVEVWVLQADEKTKRISLSMFQPRHIAEGRPQTLGERLDQQKGARGRRRRGREETPGALSRAARVPESRRGRQRRPPLTPEGKPDASRGAVEEGVRRPRRGDRYGDSGRDRATRASRIYTVESGKEVAETRGRKGELTSLAGLRALLRKTEPEAEDPRPS
ncbi:MAG: Tex family protein [Planctomycetota bacterium]